MAPRPLIALVVMPLALAMLFIWSGYHSDDASGLQLIGVFMGGALALLAMLPISLVGLRYRFPRWVLPSYLGAALLGLGPEVFGLRYTTRVVLAGEWVAVLLTVLVAAATVSTLRAGDGARGDPPKSVG